MALKQYWLIIWRRAWIPLLLVGVVAGGSLLTMQTPPPTYSTSMRFNVGLEPQTEGDEYDYDGYYAWLSSEYMVDNLTGLVSSQDFAADVNRHLTEAGSSVQIPAGIIAVDKQHRLVRLSVSWSDPAALSDIAAAIETAMREDSAKYFPQSANTASVIQVIDPPSPPAPVPTPLTQRLQLPVRLLLAFVAGLALTFLLDYLDDSVRERSELEAMGITVLAEVPKKK